MARPFALLALLPLVTGLSGCTSGGSSNATPAPTAAPTSAPAPTSASCPPSADLTGSEGFPERQGVGEGITLWAVFFPTKGRIIAGEEIKIAWRITGSGPLVMRATGPDGRWVAPVDGLDPHLSSSWQRPGDEWGTRWVFPSAGCWMVQAMRDAGQHAELSVRVAAS